MATAPIELTRVGTNVRSLVGARGLARVGASGLPPVGAIVLALVGAIVLPRVGAMGVMAAHHSVLPFDGDKPVTIHGSVARILWQNPHTLIAVDVSVAGGLQPSGSERWTIESEGSTVLQRLGWTDTLITAGDRITVTGARAKDGRRLMRCTVITLADGRMVQCFS